MRKIQCETCGVRDQLAVCSVPAEALEDFKAAGTTSTYRPHQVVFSEGNPSGGLYLVCHGAVKLFHSDRFGRDHILEIAGPSAVLGELPVEPDQPLSVSAETLTEAQLCYLPRDRLLPFVQKYPATGVRLIEALSRELALARRKVRDLALKRAESRLAALLIQLATAQVGTAGNDLELAYTRREIAEMIGVSTETAIRLLAKLRKKEILAVDGRSLSILDMDRLTRVAHYSDVDA